MSKILVADDSIAVRKVAERLLTEAGLGVTLAANGEEALAYLSKERPDVVVSDVIMPDKSGYEVCAFVRGHASLATTPVLLISGIVNDEVTKQAESCHADGVLKKPFQGTSLKDRVLELLAKRQAPAAALPPAAQVPKPVASAEGWNGPRITVEQLETYKQAVAQVKDVDAQLQAERAQSAGLRKRVGELEALAGHAKELEGQLAAERHRVEEAGNQSSRAQAFEADLAQERSQVISLKAQIARSEAMLSEMQSKVSVLESALKTEQDSTQGHRQQIADLQQAVSVVPQLEATLMTERDRNAVLVRRVSESEQSAEQSMKRFEDMARKLGEIAGLASQLGSGKGRA